MARAVGVVQKEIQSSEQPRHAKSLSSIRISNHPNVLVYAIQHVCLRWARESMQCCGSTASFSLCRYSLGIAACQNASVGDIARRYDATNKRLHH